MSAIDQVLVRLDARPNGRDRWRCACPVCGGSNKSTLSIGVGDGDCVLLKCWKSGCGPEEIARAIGLEIGDLFPGGEQYARPPQKRRMLTASQALALLADEMLLTVVCDSDMAQGKALDGSTRDRLQLGAARVSMMHTEAHS